MLDEGICRGCNAPIYWTRTVAGKRTPVDRRKVTLVVPGPEGAQVLSGYVSHFTTCPAAGQFRRETADLPGQGALL